MKPPLLVLQDPQQGDIGIVNSNMIEMIRAYTQALPAYHKICDVIGHAKLPVHTT
jgi:hypothetical protein